jgi:ComF family protein
MRPLVHRWLRLAAGFATAGTNLLFPPRCSCCDADLPGGGAGVLLCAECRGLTGVDVGPRCPTCGAVAQTDGELPDRCPRCREFPLKLDAVITLGSYQSRLRDVVLRMKRPTHQMLSVAMGRLLAQRRRRELAELGADWVVPVPMYWTRRLRRGVNSPEILAGRRNTRPQADLSPRERFRNVRGAFRARPGYHLQGARVLLVDDILTTGATCSEAAGVLKQAGAAMVAAVVVARAQGPIPP